MTAAIAMAAGAAAAGQNHRSGNVNGATVKFGSNGAITLTGSGSSASGHLNVPQGPSWFSPRKTGIGSSYALRTTRTSGLSFSTGSGWSALSSDVTVSATGGAGSTTGTWEISEAGDNNIIVARGSIVVSNAT